jgi:hypothetical protein
VPRRRLALSLFLAALGLAAPRTIAATAAGRTWYVDAVHGDDVRDGTSEPQAFRTLGRALSDRGSLKAGDTVRMKAGLYRERVRAQRSGNPDRPIRIQAFGNGEVVLDGSAEVTGWTLASGEIYRARIGWKPTAVVVDGRPLIPEASETTLAEGRFAYDAAAGSLAVWCPGGGSPASRTVGVVADDDQQIALFLDHASHVVVEGLSVRFAGGSGIAITGDDVRIERCNVGWNGKHGIVVFSWGDVAAADARIVRNEIHHNMLRNWPRGRYKWGGWGTGASSQGTPGAVFEGNVVYRNNGEGLLAYLGKGGTVFRGNVVHDNWSVNIYVDNQPNARIEGNFIYAEPPDPRDLTNNGDDKPGDGVCMKRLRPTGIMTADEKYGPNPTARLSDVTIANNVVVNCLRGINHYGQAPGSGLKNVKVLHNTIVVPDKQLPGEPPATGIAIPYNGGNNAGSVYRNNIVYATNPETMLLWSDATSSVEKFLGLQMDHNLWFHATRAKPFHWGEDGRRGDYTLAEWQALPGLIHGTGDVFADPLLANPGSLDAEGERPRPGSPAVDRGVDAGIVLDYSGAPRPANGRFDLGAFEVGSAPARASQP